MINVAAYDASGYLRFAMLVSPAADLSAIRAAHPVVQTSEADLADTWFDTAAQTPKPRSALPAPSKTTIAADGVDVASWTALPNPSTVIVAGQGVYQVTGGTFEFSAEVAGEYAFTLIGPPSYRPQIEVIRAA